MHPGAVNPRCRVIPYTVALRQIELGKVWVRVTKFTTKQSGTARISPLKEVGFFI